MLIGTEDVASVITLSFHFGFPAKGTALVLANVVTSAPICEDVARSASGHWRNPSHDLETHGCSQDGSSSPKKNLRCPSSASLPDDSPKGTNEETCGGQL